MRTFDYHLATSPADAVATMAQHPDAAYLAGGTNLVDHMKLGVAEPDMLVDVSRLELTETVTTDDGVRIGANVHNSDLAADPVIRAHYPMLSRALLSGASGQLRNAASTAGNLLQRTRCVYFQDVTTPCNKRTPGSGCSALGGYVRYHAILGASPHCVAVHPSDMAVAMTALDAVIVVQGADGERRIPIDDFYRLPGDEPDRDTVLRHGELITAVDLPAARTTRSRTTARSATARRTHSPWCPSASSSPSPKPSKSVRHESLWEAWRTNRGGRVGPRRCWRVISRRMRPLPPRPTPNWPRHNRCPATSSR